MLQSIPHNHPAVGLLTQLNGLTVGECGTGEECASSDITFECYGDLQQDSTVLQWQQILSTTLVNIASVDHSHGALFMDSLGACYGMSLVHDAFWFDGNCFGVAAERILLGRKARPMLRPGQTTISLYGETYTADHPNIYHYNSQHRIA